MFVPNVQLTIIEQNKTTKMLEDFQAISNAPQTRQNQIGKGLGIISTDSQGIVAEF
jgi:hypothetical protein